MEVFWTRFAIYSLKSIYIYYSLRASESIAKKILKTIFQATRRLHSFPNSGSIEPILIDLDQNHRYIIAGNYKIIYKIQNQKIFITDVFDSRQDPKKLKSRNLNDIK